MIESELPTKESGVGSWESGVKVTKSGVNMGVLAQAIKQRTENPQISSWNPLVMVVLKYKNLTTPAYSTSKEICELLEIAIKERYPDLPEQVEKAFAKKCPRSCFVGTFITWGSMAKSELARRLQMRLNELDIVLRELERPRISSSQR